MFLLLHVEAAKSVWRQEALGSSQQEAPGSSQLEMPPPHCCVLVPSGWTGSCDGAAQLSGLKLKKKNVMESQEFVHSWDGGPAVGGWGMGF